LPRAVDEFIDLFDTPSTIEAIINRYPEHAKRGDIIIYPDAAGNSRKTDDATKTDVLLLKQAGFAVSVNKANPPVKDRINTMNAAFRNANGDRRYRVNIDKCPVYTSALEGQGWKNGEPDKDSPHSHRNDAAGYFIIRVLPIALGEYTGGI
jgi:hypothetical protein